jgi:hypothetical protein
LKDWICCRYLNSPFTFGSSNVITFFFSWIRFPHVWLPIRRKERSTMMMKQPIKTGKVEVLTQGLRDRFFNTGLTCLQAFSIKPWFFQALCSNDNMNWLLLTQVIIYRLESDIGGDIGLVSEIGAAWFCSTVMSTESRKEDEITPLIDLTIIPLVDITESSDEE